MKKRNVMTMALSLAMVGVIGAGATLAYFADSDDAVTNSFTFAGGAGGGDAITVFLDEFVPGNPGGNATAAPKDGEGEKGYDYSNVVPGDTLTKVPTVSVDSEIDCYVFLKVTDNDDVAVKWSDSNPAWTEIEDAGLLPGQRVYYYSGEKCKEGMNGVVPAGNTVLISEEDQAEALFTQVEVQTTATDDAGDGKLDDVIIQVAAIQATGFTSAQNAYENNEGDLEFLG